MRGAGILVGAFTRDWYETPGSPLPVALRTHVLDQAASSAAAHGLRAYDAVQLGCAITARGADPATDVFLRFGRELRDAAGQERFPVTV